MTMWYRNICKATFNSICVFVCNTPYFSFISVDDDDFNWKLACIQREEQHTMWSDHENNMESFCLSMAHFAAVDAVHLLKVKIMASHFLIELDFNLLLLF